MLEDAIKEWGGAEVSAMEVYGDMFHLGEGLIQRENEQAGQFKGNPLGYYRNKGERKGHYRILFEDTFADVLQELQGADFAIVNGVTYFGRRNLQAHASKMYAMLFDLDGVTEDSLYAFLSGAIVGGAYPVPNYIALSGHGVHLYYLFEYPVPLYPNIKLQLKALKYALTDKMWNHYTSKITKKQFQGINQGFRPIGGKTKIEGVKVRAFRVNVHPFNLEQLSEYVPQESRVDETKLYKESKLTLEQAKVKYPAWYQDKVINKKPQQYWTCKIDLYNWWIRQIQTQATYGHRYFCIMCLAIYGVKCGVPYQQVKQDAVDLMPFLNSLNPKEPFTKNDIKSALECYDMRYCTFPAKDIGKISGVSMPKNKRNYQRQSEHLEEARAIRDIRMKRQDRKWNDSSGRKPKENIVVEWRIMNPKKKKADCIRETGLSKPTVYKYWSCDKAIRLLTYMRKISAEETEITTA